MRIRFSRRLALAACSFALALPLLALGASGAGADDVDPATPPATPAELGPIGHSGRWLTTADGRVLLLNGVNFVDKNADDTTIEELGFGEDDAQFLEDNGIDAVRLGFSPLQIMPKPGVIDTAFVASYVKSVELLQAHGILVLVDLHQDGWGPAVDGNGFPAWMTLTHGATNTHTAFPLYYVTNPAIQASFDSFWKNEPGPGGKGLQDQVGAMMAALAAPLAGNDAVLGYDLINEPWPGTNFSDCAAAGPGCPSQDAGQLDPFYARMAKAIRATDKTHMLFGEPWVLFNFGLSPTHVALPGGDRNSGLSFHMYTVDTAKEPVVVDEAAKWSDRTGGALLGSEFGATTDTGAIDRQIKEFDHGLVPWMFWAYQELVGNLTAPLSGNVTGSTADAVIRPHPLAVAGTPTALDYDQPNRVLRFTWSTKGPAARTYPEGTETTFQVAPRTYPAGYEVGVEGGKVTSAPDAKALTVVADPGADEVRVVVYPADQTNPGLDIPTTTTVPATTTPATTVPPPTEPPTPVPPGQTPPAIPVDAPARFTG